MNNVIMNVRPYQLLDQGSVNSLISTIQREEYGIPIRVEDQPDLSDIPNFYQKGSGNFWVAMAPEVVGTIALLDIGNQQVALRKMFVREDFRGRATGAAQKLLGTALDWAKGKGIHEVLLGTTAQFLAAHRFYEKNGFELINKGDLPSTFPVMSVDTRFYRKLL